MRFTPNDRPFWLGGAVQIRIRQIRGAEDWRESQVLLDTGGF